MITRKGKVCAITLWLIFGASRAAMSNEPDGALPGDVCLIIAGSRANPSGDNENEFLVLRSTGDRVLWKATAHLFRCRSEKTGHVQPGRVSLSDVFDKVSTARSGNGEGAPAIPFTSFFSLVIVDRHGARACSVLDAGQQAALREMLGPVFKDVLKHGPYAKAHIMLDILWPPDALRSTGTLRR
jgi:hypothetical protein